MKRIEKKALSLWRVRLCLVTFFCPLVVALFFFGFPVWRTGLTILWAALFIGMYAGYYPLKYHRLSYKLTSKSLVIHCGVFYDRVKAMELANVQQVTTGATPLQRLMGLCSVYVHGAGGTVYIPCLRPEEAERLCGKLSGGR